MARSPHRINQVASTALEDRDRADYPRQGVRGSQISSDPDDPSDLVGGERVEMIIESVTPLADALAEAGRTVQQVVDGMGQVEGDRALEFTVAAYDLATEMWFQKGDPGDPALTNWERPWRKYGGDNPTTIYLSAAVSPDHQYRLRGNTGPAIYAGVQIYTRGPGYNAPSANISDRALNTDSGDIDLLIGGRDPADGRPWLPLTGQDYLAMLRLYHDKPVATPTFQLDRIDPAVVVPLTPARRARTAEEFFRDQIRSTMSVTDTLRAAGVNRYPAPDAPVQAPRYTGALFPTLDNAYDGFFVDLAPGQHVVLRGRLPRARFSSFVFYDRWFNTPDLTRHRCYLTDREVKANKDDEYELVLGPDDPSHPNWIDTAGLRQGIFAIRCLLPEEHRLPAVQVV